jgi:hypothetical protein
VKTLIALFLFCGLQVAAQDMQSCPMHTEQMKAAQQRADVGKMATRRRDSRMTRRHIISASTRTVGH